MRRILLIEDQLDFQIMVKTALQQQYEVLVASTAEDGLRMADHADVELILLDVGLPDEDGLSLFSKLKALPHSSSIPVLFLTGRSSTEDIVTAFQLGADDYIIKPFNSDAFRARIDARMRALLNRRIPPIIIRKGSIELDCAMSKAYEVGHRSDRRDLELTPHEFRLLVHFVQNEGQVLTRDQLMAAVWGNSTHVLIRTVDRHISSLRKKLNPDYGSVDAVHNSGYRFSLGSVAHEIPRRG